MDVDGREILRVQHESAPAPSPGETHRRVLPASASVADIRVEQLQMAQ